MTDHHIKSGQNAASIRGIQPELAIALTLLCHLFARHKVAVRLSAGVDSKHKAASLHYVGHAIDISYRNIPQYLITLLHAEMRSVLGDEFDVIAETTHFHVEFQPKKPLNME